LSHASPVRLRPATPDDERRLWEWANDPAVRRFAFSTEAIPYDDHARWFAARLADRGCRLFIVEDRDGQPVGQIRTDRRDGGALEISVSIAEAHRGRGLGTAALRALEREFQRGGETVRLFGRVKGSNAASAAAFRRAGYEPLPEQVVHGETVLVFGREVVAPAARRSARTVLVVQARTGSTRLPNKVLADIGGEPMLARVVRRARLSRLVSEVVIATSTLPTDDPIEALATSLGVRCIRGSERDVLDRYLQAADATNADVVVRITADCPLIDADVVDDVVRTLIDSDESVDYCSNVLTRTFPRGLDVEAFTRAALERTAAEARAPREREHVTLYMVEHPELFRQRSVTSPVDAGRHRWTVDEEADLSFVRAVYQRLPADAPWRLILREVDADASLPAINAGVQQKAS
jgi:spore coat polysaccharide biosynthesis protein SpsF